LSCNVLDQFLVKSAFVNEDEGLADDEREEDFVDHAELGKAEEKNESRDHQPMLDELSPTSLLLCMRSRHDGQSAARLGNQKLTD
jgi:hypothetical protein